MSRPMIPEAAVSADTVARWSAPSGWQAIDFISDLHLASNTPATFDAFASYMGGTTADAVVILGDLFEVWIGDDVRHQPFEARCLEVVAAAAARRTVAFMVGNRDFLVGPAWCAEAGVRPLDDPTLLEAFGSRALLAHGDALCLDDHDYQRFRQFVRQPGWQAMFLAKPLAERQAMARQIRDASEQKKANGGEAAWSDLDRPAMLAQLEAAGAPVLIHGHTHRPGHQDLAPGYVREVLSDWDLDGLHGPARAEVLRWTAQGLARHAPNALV